MKNIILTFFLCTLGIFGNAQDEKPIYKNDVNFNATSLLGNLLSLNSNELGVPYMISYRRHNGSQAFRLSLGGNLDKRTSFFGENTDTALNIRLGYELIKSLSRKVSLTYGFDLVGNYYNEESFILTSQDLFIQTNKIVQIGGGPSVRLFYTLNSRISFHTETSIYGLVGTEKTTFNSSSIPDEELDTLSLKLAVPQALFITIAF